jgi:hypothetical protein
MKKILLLVLFFIVTVFDNVYADPIKVGPLSYYIDKAEILDVDKEKKMNMFNKKPNPQYLAVRITVTNMGNIPITLPPIFLIEDAETVYEPTILAGYLDGYESLKPERLNPYARVTRWVFFDMCYYNRSKYELRIINIDGSGAVSVPLVNIKDWRH